MTAKVALNVDNINILYIDAQSCPFVILFKRKFSNLQIIKVMKNEKKVDIFIYFFRNKKMKWEVDMLYIQQENCDSKIHDIIISWSWND